MKRALQITLTIWLGASGLAYAQEPLRSDLIETARKEKEAELSPEVPPKGQRVFERVENSLPYQLMTGQTHGFGVSFGNIAPGAGFAIGPTYVKPLWDGKLVFRADARASVNSSPRDSSSARIASRLGIGRS